MKEKGKKEKRYFVDWLDGIDAKWKKKFGKYSSGLFVLLFLLLFATLSAISMYILKSFFAGVALVFIPLGIMSVIITYAYIISYLRKNKDADTESTD